MSLERSKKWHASLALLAAGLFFGLSSPLARAMGTWLQPFSVVFVRFLFALPFAGGFALLDRSTRAVSTKKLPIWKLCIFAGIFPISVCIYTFSLFYTKVSLTIFSFYIANVASSIIIGRIANKERLNRNKLIGFLLAIAAVICFTNPFQGFVVSTGMLFGYLSGIFQSVASLYQKRLSRETTSRILTLTQVLGGLTFTLVAMFFIQDASVFHLTPPGAALSLLFGFLFFLINYLMIYGFKRAELGVGTILLSSELIFGPLVAYLLFHETLSRLEMLGGILIIGAVLMVSRRDKIFDKKGLPRKKEEI